MPQAYPFASIERFLVKWLPTVAGGVHALTDLPRDFQDEDGATHLLPVIAVDRISGAELDDSPILDRPVIDIDVYAGSRAQAQDLSEQIRYALRWTLQGSKVDDLVFGRVRTIVGPRLLAHANPKVRRYSATYELLLHVQP